MSCVLCRFARTDMKRKVLDVGNGALELIKTTDDAFAFYSCNHPGRGGEQGFADRNPGVDCTFFEEPERKAHKLPAHLQKLLANSEARAVEDKEA